jgi:hypothetical protein
MRPVRSAKAGFAARDRASAGGTMRRIFLLRSSSDTPRPGSIRYRTHPCGVTVAAAVTGFSSPVHAALIGLRYCFGHGDWPAHEAQARMAAVARRCYRDRGGLLGWHALLSVQGEAEQAYLTRTLFPLMGGLWLAIAGLCGLAL